MHGYEKPGKDELRDRLNRLTQRLNLRVENWKTVLIVNQINQYYLTGTKQEGVFVIRRDAEPVFFVRRSVERAHLECDCWDVRPMRSYAQVTEVFGRDLGVTLLETDTITLSAMDRVRKVMDIPAVHSLEPHMLAVRSVKSPFEIALLRRAGAFHKRMMEEIVPELLCEGISEAAFLGRLYARLLELGHHGVARFRMPQMELIGGQLGFGESAVYPSAFDGAGGMRGQSPAVPFIGSRERTLRKGDLVFVDIVSGIDGYHTDKTQMYCFGGKPCTDALREHAECLSLLHKAADMLRPGITPEQIWRQCTEDLSPAFLENFMGYGSRRVSFLGHGVGLEVDEAPVIAKGFTELLEAGMTIALEPKKGRAEGMVGAEETYLITENEPECLTGGAGDIICI